MEPAFLGACPGVYCPPDRQKVITPPMVEIAKTLTKEQLAYILFKGGS